VLAATNANLLQNDRDVRRARLLLVSGSGSTEAPNTWIRLARSFSRRRPRIVRRSKQHNDSWRS